MMDSDPWTKTPPEPPPPDHPYHLLEQLRIAWAQSEEADLAVRVAQILEQDHFTLLWSGLPFSALWISWQDNHGTVQEMPAQAISYARALLSRSSTLHVLHPGTTDHTHQHQYHASELHAAAKIQQAHVQRVSALWTELTGEFPEAFAVTASGSFGRPPRLRTLTITRSEHGDVHVTADPPTSMLSRAVAARLLDAVLHTQQDTHPAATLHITG